MTAIDTMTKDELVTEIGRLILTDSTYASGGWRGITIIATVQPGVRSLDGFLYPEGDGHGYSELPDENGSPVSAACRRLNEVMAAQSGKPWVQMLYQIWMPGPDFAVNFEYGNPKRWSLFSQTEGGIQGFADAMDPRNRLEGAAPGGN